jgi:hypothetical protein
LYEGLYNKVLSSLQVIRERLEKEVENNVSIQVRPYPCPGSLSLSLSLNRAKLR